MKLINRLGIIMIAIQLVSCINSGYPIDKIFKNINNAKNENSDQKYSLVLSYKSDKCMYYKFDMAIYENQSDSTHNYVRIFDKNKLLLKEFAPGWDVVSDIERSDKGISYRGKIDFEEEVFKEITDIEVIKK